MVIVVELLWVAMKVTEVMVDLDAVAVVAVAANRKDDADCCCHVLVVDWVWWRERIHAA